MMNASISSNIRPRRWRRIVAAQIGIVVLGLLSLEVGARAWLRLRNNPYDAGETRTEVLQLLRLDRNLLPGSDEGSPTDSIEDHGIDVLHPYVGWEAAGGFGQLDEDYRWLHSPSRADEMQVLLVGGSVAAHFGTDGDGWGKLRSTLLADPALRGRGIHALSYARSGYKQPQQINFVLFLLGLGFKPDVVINIDGFNEVALGNNNKAGGSHPVFPSADHWAHLTVSVAGDREAIDRVSEIRRTQRTLESWGKFIETWHLERSCLLGKVALRRMYKLRSLVVAQFKAYDQHLVDHQKGSAAHEPGLEGGELEAVNASVQCWKESSRCLSDICRGRGIIYIHVLQPTLHDSGSKPLTAKEIEKGRVADAWVNGVKLGYPLLRKEGEDLRRLGVDFIDASQIFKSRGDELYYDCCHFGSPGNEVMADAIAPELLKRLAEKK